MNMTEKCKDGQHDWTWDIIQLDKVIHCLRCPEALTLEQYGELKIAEGRRLEREEITQSFPSHLEVFPKTIDSKTASQMSNMYANYMVKQERQKVLAEVRELHKRTCSKSFIGFENTFCYECQFLEKLEPQTEKSKPAEPQQFVSGGASSSQECNHPAGYSIWVCAMCGYAEGYVKLSDVEKIIREKRSLSWSAWDALEQAIRQLATKGETK